MSTGITQSQPSCCPVVLGTVCHTTGQAFAIYEPSTGVTTYRDTITNAVVPAANIRACPDTTVVTTDNLVVAAHIVSSAAGNTVAGLSSVTFTNVGAANGTVAGAAIAPGESITFTAYLDPASKVFKRLPAIAYSGVGTVLSISTLT